MSLLPVGKTFLYTKNLKQLVFYPYSIYWGFTTPLLPRQESHLQQGQGMFKNKTIGIKPGTPR